MSIGCVYSNGLCSNETEYSKLGRLSERDLSLDNSIAGLFIPGMDVNKLVFERYGYTYNSSSIVTDLIDAGLKRLYLDVYYDLDHDLWHLCPNVQSNSTSQSKYTNSTNATYTSSNETINDSSCDFRLNFQSLMSSISEYIELSDTNIAANLLYLHLRPHIWQSSGPESMESEILAGGAKSLAGVIQSTLGNRTLTPQQLEIDQSNSNLVTEKGVNPQTPRDKLWPSLRTMLYTNYRRLVITFNNTLINDVPSLNDLYQVGFPYTTTIDDPDDYSISELASMNFSDTFVYDLNQWQEALHSGVSPVLAVNVDVYTSEFVKFLSDHICWCWARDQPTLFTIQERQDMVKNGFTEADNFTACASLTKNSLAVDNCHHKYRVLCAKKHDSFDWLISEEQTSYFNPDCPKGYNFGLPSNPVQLRYVLKMMEEEKVDVIWSDFNSLFLPNCWVDGGTSAVCPYNVHENDRNGIGYIVIVGTICVALFIGIFLLEWARGKAPLARKRLVIERKKVVEYEGVPS